VEGVGTKSWAWLANQRTIAKVAVAERMESLRVKETEMMCARNVLQVTSLCDDNGF
jgi:hypothetical protein